MKIEVTRSELLGCPDGDAWLALLTTKGVDVKRSFAIQGHATEGNFTLTQEDLKKERPGSSQFEYCWACKEVTELAGETCSECGAFLKT